MNILFITLYPLELNSSVSVSSRSIIKGMLSLGHSITVVMPNSESGQLEEEIKHLPIIRIPGKMKPLSNKYIVNKIHSKIEIYDFKVHSLLRSARQIKLPDVYFDIVFSVSDPLDSHIFAKRLIKRGLKYGKWVQHWGDPVWGNISHKLLWPKFVIKMYESFIIGRADKIVYVTPFSADTQRMLHKKYKNKIQFTPLPVDCLNKEDTPIHSVLKIAYVGDYSRYIRNIIPLYEACSQLDDVDLTIAGYGVPLQSRQNIHVLSRVPYEIARQLENESDVLVGICNLHGTQIPGKIFYKAGTNKHILVSLEKDNKDNMREYFDSYGRYIICDNDKDSIIAAIKNIKSIKPNYTTPSRLLPDHVVRELLC